MFNARARDSVFCRHRVAETNQDKPVQETYAFIIQCLYKLFDAVKITKQTLNNPFYLILSDLKKQKHPF